MESELEKKIRVRLEELPEDIQKAVKSADLDEKIRKIGVKHNLHVDQIESLDIEVRLVMLGFVDPVEFLNELKNNVRVSENEAESIADDVSVEILLPIRDSMRQYMEERALQTQVKEEVSQSEKKEGAQVELKTSVIMPSATATPPPPVATVVTTPAPIPPKIVTPPVAVPPAKPADLHAADLMLSEPTVSMAPKPAAPAIPPAPVVSAPAPAPAAAKVEPPKPAPYKADPYREPPE